MAILENAYYNEFLDLYRKTPERVVFFLGAGLSRPLFPDWKSLLTQFLEYVHSAGKLSYSKDELLDDIGNNRSFLEVAEACVKDLGKSGYRSFVESKFDQEITITDIPESSKELFALQPLTVVTTNYDRIPDVASAGTYRVVTNRNAPEGQRAFEQMKKLIFKIHGDIGDQESLVLTSEEFDRVYFDNGATQNLIRSIFSTRTVLFLGFGLSDPHLDLILKSLRTQSDGKPVTHYALLSEVSRFKLDALEAKYGVKIISYSPSTPAHPEVTEFLRRLKTTPNLATPSSTVATPAVVAAEINARLKRIGYVKLCVLFDNAHKSLEVSVFCRGATEMEHQKELLAISRAISLNTDIVSLVKISLHVSTGQSESTVEFCPVILSAEFNFSDVRLFSEGKSNVQEFWSKIQFTAPSGVATVESLKRRVEFPFIGVD